MYSNSASSDKSVSEKLAELESRYSRVSERASMGSYTLSFDEEDEVSCEDLQKT